MNDSQEEEGINDLTCRCVVGFAFPKLVFCVSIMAYESKKVAVLTPVVIPNSINDVWSNF